MDHYLDIRIRPDPEFSAPHLMSTLFAKLHRAFVVLQSTDIGVSFPDMDEKKPSLGTRLRLHASADRLQAIADCSRLGGLEDHLQIARPVLAPPDAHYRKVSRVQSDSSPERLRRRLMRRHNLSEAETRLRIPDSAVKTLGLPFVTLRSQSSGHTFRLFIRHGVLQSTPEPGAFSCYGLSAAATIPWF
ncbi:type I-F CRISPR-associated endoribonuclease Cas6/Csy4 [Alphaproteobacteria bacterium]|nr:type I-F CRISPR-associated endoribonuclease Cas6/Csy4 [Alphaproteobacteria bacterium]